MQTTPLSEATAARILDAAWQLVVDRGRADVGLGEIAKAAGVSRQSIYLAFGNRAGLLVAMARRADAASPHSRRMGALARGRGADARTLVHFVRAWLRHLPEVYPVGTLLLAAAATDADAAAVLQDRLVGSLLGAYRDILERLAAAGQLVPGWTAERAADCCWSLTHIDAWRHLVVERGWQPEAFSDHCVDTIRCLMLVD